MSSELIAKRVIYSVWVQGVGFRMTAVRIAQKFHVTGWARNLSDGRVELLVEGLADEVDAFLQAMRTRWQRSLNGEESKDQAVCMSYRSFEIAY
jgi:acylphosphatase